MAQRAGEGVTAATSTIVVAQYRTPGTSLLLVAPMRFRADQVDALVWDWLKEKLSGPGRLTQGLEDYQAEQDKANEPLRARLAVVDSLIADNRKQLEKLLDLYLTDDFPKEMLTDRKARLETTIGALDKERAGLVAQLEVQTLTRAQIQSLQEFSTRIGKGMENADFQTRRGLIEDLDVTVTLTVEDGEKVAYPRCILPWGRDVLFIDTQHTGWGLNNQVLEDFESLSELVLKAPEDYDILVTE
jgi:hypothetical protein